MISKINSFNERKNNINFQSFRNYNHLMLNGEAYKQALTLRNTCKEIFSNIRKNKNLIEGAKSKLGNLKLSDKSMTFKLSKSDSARLAMPRGDEGNLFTMQILRDKKPINTVTINENNCLIESYSLNNETFLPEERYNKIFIDKTVKIVFDSVDYPLLQLRRYIKQNSAQTQEKKSNEAALKSIIDKQEAKKTESNTSFLPPSSNWGEFSFSEIIKQNAENYKPKQGVKRYTVIPKKRIYEIEGVNIPKRTPQRNKSTVSRIEEPVTKQEELITKVVQKHRGRPPKVKNPEIINVVKSEDINEVQHKKVGRKRASILPVGIINQDTQAKVNEIKAIYEEIKTILANKSNVTASKIRNSYADLKKSKHKGFYFKDLEVLISKSLKLKDEEIMHITDSNTLKSIHITLSGKIFASDKNWSKLNNSLTRPKYLTQEKIDEVFQQNSVNELIDKTLSNLKKFKKYIDNQGWRVRKDDKTLKKDWIVLEQELLQKLNNITESYTNSKKIISSLSYTQINSIVKHYSAIKKTRAGDFEIVNPLNDGKNYLFSLSSNKFGEFYKIAKLSEKGDLEEIFVISTDGKILENISKTRGFKQPFPTGTNMNARYLTESLSENDSKTLEEIISVLEKEIINYEKFLTDSKVNLTKPRTEKGFSMQSNSINFSIVKKFLDKTVSELQTSADKLREITGFKSTLDSVAESLRTKFEEFLKQFK